MSYIENSRLQLSSFIADGERIIIDCVGRTITVVKKGVVLGKIILPDEDTDILHYQPMALINIFNGVKLESKNLSD